MAQCFLNDGQLTQIAKLINPLVNIPIVPEEQEEALIKGALKIICGLIAELIPDVLKNKLDNPDDGIDPDQARGFADRLKQTVLQRINLPFVGEATERQIVGAFVDIITKGMIKGRSLTKVLG